MQADSGQIGSEAWLRERFPDKDWHRHPRTDGRTDLCDGTPSDCTSKVRLPYGSAVDLMAALEVSVKEVRRG